MEQELEWEIGKTYRMRRGAGVKKEFLESEAMPTYIQQKVFDFYGYKHFTVLALERCRDVLETSLGDCEGLNPFVASERHLFEEVPTKEPVPDDLATTLDPIKLTVQEVNAGIVAGIENLDKGAELRKLLEAAIQTMPFYLNLNCEKVQIKSLEQLEKLLKRKVKAKARNVEDIINGLEKRIGADEKSLTDAKNEHTFLKSVLS